MDISLAVTREPPRCRRVWDFTQTDWQGPQVAIKLLDWSPIATFSNILSSPLPVQAGVPQGSVLSHVIFLVFMIHPTLWKIFFISLLMTPPSAVPSLILQIGKQQPLHYLQIWIKSQGGPTLGTCLSILLSLTLTMSLRKNCLEISPTPPIYFLNNPLEEVLSFKLVGLTICHGLS